MSKQIVFKNHTLNTHFFNSQIWFESAQLAIALGYSNPKAVTGLYANYKDEFTEGMTEVLDSNTSENLKVRRRVFSLRGAHLIAMFSKTPIAKDFRKWVLNLLDKEATKNQVPQSSIVLTPNREILPKMVYHHQSKYNPYRAYVSDNGRTTYVGCFPTVESAVAAQKIYVEKGTIKRLKVSVLKNVAKSPANDLIAESSKELKRQNLTKGINALGEALTLVDVTNLSDDFIPKLGHLLLAATE